MVLRSVKMGKLYYLRSCSLHWLRCLVEFQRKFKSKEAGFRPWVCLSTELKAVSSVLGDAAMTYVASAALLFFQLLRCLSYLGQEELMPGARSIALQNYLF